MSVNRRSMLAAVRDRMRQRARVLDDENADRDGRAAVPRTVDPPSPPAQPDPELEQLAAEARYHRDRFELYRARVISGSSTATSSARLRELERTATSAQERLGHARRSRRSSSRDSAS